MKFLLCLIAVVACQAALPAESLETAQQLLTLAQSGQSAVLNHLQTMGTVTVNPLQGLCNGSEFNAAFGALSGQLPGLNLNLGQLQGCYGGLCNAIDACPTLFSYVGSDSTGGGAYCPLDSISVNCGNGCFGKLIGPVANIGQCIVNWFNSVLGQICNLVVQESQMAGMPITFAQCETMFAGFGAAAGSGASFAPIVESFDALCYAQPATGNLCYGYAVGAYGNGEWTSCNYLQNMGCCVPILLKQTRLFNDTQLPCGTNFLLPQSYSEFLSAASTCGVTSVPACPAAGQTVKYVLNNWLLSGIDFANVYALNLDSRWAFYNALRSDIAASLMLTGTSLNWITVANVSYAGTAGSVIVTFTVRADTDADTATVQVSITTLLTGTTTVSFSATNTFATMNGLLQMGSSGVGLSKTGSSSTTESQSGATSDAAATGASLLVVFAAMIVAVFRF